MNDSVSLVLPTFDRVEALRDTLPVYLAVEGVQEIVVVDDGSTDGTAEFLAAVTDPRLRVVRLPARRGQPAARNRGVDETSGEWVVFGEDDCHVAPGYARALVSVARRDNADIVGAPWLFLGDRDLPQAIAQGRRTAVDRIALDQVDRFPATTIATPFLPALALVRRRVLDALRYDEGYRGNAYREESDFFIRAARAGFRVLLTPETCSFQLRHYAGGARMARWRYELWTLRNDARFVARHGTWLREQGLMGARPVHLARFAATRLRGLAEHEARRHGGRVRRAWRRRR